MSEAYPQDLSPFDRVFSAYEWEGPDTLEGELRTPAYLKYKRRKRIAEPFQRAVMAVREGVFPSLSLDLDTPIDLTEDLFRPGVLVRFEKEELRAGKQLSSDEKRGIELPSDHPIQASHFIDCLPESLIALVNQRTGQPSEVGSGRILIARDFKEQSEASHWEYSREFWYAVVIPTAEGARLFSFPKVGADPKSFINPGALAKTAYEVGPRLAPAVIGRATHAQTQSVGVTFHKYERFNGLTVYPGTVPLFVKSLGRTGLRRNPL